MTCDEEINDSEVMSHTQCFPKSGYALIGEWWKGTGAQEVPHPDPAIFLESQSGYWIGESRPLYAPNILISAQF